MNLLKIKVLGTIVYIFTGLFIGGVGGLVGSYLMWLSDPKYSFGYSPMFIFGTTFGAYGVYYSIKKIWLN